MNLFSHCVLTASDESQAEAFRSLLSRRIRHGLYPREISFHVYPDPPGRVGSGGGTLWALHRLYEELGLDPLRDLGQADASSVLLLHAAGESRRLPVFAPEGKLFAPVPVPSSSSSRSAPPPPRPAKPYSRKSRPARFVSGSTSSSCPPRSAP